MKRLVVFIISVFILGCEKNKMNFYEADFYGNSVEIPEFLIYNEKEVETELKYYCKNNLYFKDSTETTIFNAIVCEYPRIENLDYDFEYLKDVFEESCEVRKIEILELEDISIKSTNKGNYFLFENIEQSSEQKYIKRIYIAFEDLFIYIY